MIIVLKLRQAILSFSFSTYFFQLLQIIFENNVIYFKARSIKAGGLFFMVVFEL